MITKVEKLPHSRVRLTVQIEARELKTKTDEVFKQFCATFTRPGFRKGKVPKKFIEQQVKKEMIYEKAVNDLLDPTYRYAVEENALSPMHTPTVQVGEIREEEGVELIYEFDVYPEIELGEYKGLEVEHTVQEVTDEMVEMQCEYLQDQFAEMVVIDDREHAQLGDYALMDYEGYLNGEPFKDGAAMNRLILLDETAFIPGFGAQVVGMKVGEKKYIQLSLPENHPAAELAGQAITLKVKLNDLKSKRVPELDEEFARSYLDCESLMELKSRVREGLERQEEEEARRSLESKIMGLILYSSKVEVPRQMLKLHLNRLIDDVKLMVKENQMDYDAYIKEHYQTPERFVESLTPKALWEIKVTLALNAIAVKEGLEVLDEQVEQRREELIAANPNNLEFIQNFEEYRVGIEQALLRDMVLDRIISLTKSEDKSAPEENEEPSLKDS